MSEPAGVARSLVIPMKDEAGRIGRTLAAIASSDLHRDDTEILLVDDGSTDDTAAVVSTLIDRLGIRAQLLRLPRNEGKGAAVAAGVAAANGRTIAFVDADLSSPPEAVLACFEHVEAEKADVVVTTRVHPEAMISQRPPVGRMYSGKVFNILLHALGLTTLGDTQCGLKAFTAEAAHALFRDLRVRRFAFDVEVLARAERLGLTVMELPLEWRHFEASRVRPVRDGAAMALDVVRLRLALRAWARGAVVAGPAGDMDEDRFAVMARVERDHWWFAAKRALVRDAVARHLDRPEGAAADVGCGTGAMVTDLRASGFGPVAGTDLSAGALGFASDAGQVLAARAEHLPFASGSLRCLTSLDVVEHLDDDVAGLREYARAVAAGGLVVLTVPAYQWAWSDHDTQLGHRRRYTLGAITAAAEAAGLQVVHATYFHSWLVPLAFLVRRTPARHLLRGSQEEASYVSPPVNRLLGLLTRLEGRFGGDRTIPLGLSILVVARR